MSARNKRRWFQLSLRALLALVVLASVPLAQLGMRLDRIRRQEPAIAVVQRAGGAVWILREPVAAPNPLVAVNRPIYDSQRQEKGSLEQVVEDARYGEVVCIAFPSAGYTHGLVSGNGAVDIDGQEIASGSHGNWALHSDWRRYWRGDGPVVQVQPRTAFTWKTLEALPYLQVLDVGDRRLGDEDFDQLSHFTSLRALIARRSTVSDEGLRLVSRLKNLRILSLGESSITDRGLLHLANLRRLEVLELDHSRVSGSGLNHLNNMAELKLLSLRHSPLTDEGLEYIAGLAELRRLYFYNTSLTDSGLAKLQPLKNLEILHLGKTAVTFAGADAFERNLGRAATIR